MRALLPTLSLLLLLSACTSADGPDLILMDGHIVTLTDTAAAVAPTAIAIRDDLILAVGTDQEIVDLAGDQTVVRDLDGATVIPGFNDSHCHLYGLGKALAEIDLNGTASPAEVAARVAAAMETAPGRDWLQGRGWDQNDWAVQDYPTKALLDPITGDRPALLRRVDGHAALANSAALELAGITADTPDPDGGEILRDADGQPTGLLIDNGADLVRAVIPAVSPAEMKRRVLLAVEHCLRHGITGVHEAGISWARSRLYLELAKTGGLDLRLYGFFDDNAATLEQAFANGPVFTPDDMFTARTVKLYADGALGSRGALLHADYCDYPGHRGLAVTPRKHLRDVALRAGQAGFQVGTHAIGDRANTLMLDIYAEVLAELNLDDPRWRIEHAQILTATDIPRFAELGVIAAMQPVHCTSDMDWAADRLGEDRLSGAYAWRSLLDAGAHLCSGTDFPVEPVDPLAGLYSSRTRTHPDGTPPGGWQPQERLDGRTALEIYTAGSAYAAFMEDRLGRLIPGYFADLTVLTGDPVSCEPPELLEMGVIMTIVAGKIRFEEK